MALAMLGYLYFTKYSPSANVFWVDATLKIKTDWGACPPTFPCYETFLLDQEGSFYHNDESIGKLPDSKIKMLIKKAYNAQKGSVCTPYLGADVVQEYELRMDNKFYEFGGEEGCKEMQDVMQILGESINN